MSSRAGRAETTGNTMRLQVGAPLVDRDNNNVIRCSEKLAAQTDRRPLCYLSAGTDVEPTIWLRRLVFRPPTSSLRLFTCLPVAHTV